MSCPGWLVTRAHCTAWIQDLNHFSPTQFRAKIWTYMSQMQILTSINSVQSREKEKMKGKKRTNSLATLLYSAYDVNISQKPVLLTQVCMLISTLNNSELCLLITDHHRMHINKLHLQCAMIWLSLSFLHVFYKWTARNKAGGKSNVLFLPGTSSCP